MMRRPPQRAAPILAGILLGLAGQVMGADTALAPATRRATDADQRLAWRITELEGELAVLRRFAQQQDASLGDLQSQLDAAAARHTAENLTLAALWALVSGFSAWRVVRRSRP